MDCGTPRWSARPSQFTTLDRALVPLTGVRVGSKERLKKVEWLLSILLYLVSRSTVQVVQGEIITAL